MEDDERPWYRRPGWIVSALLHAGVVVATFISFAPTYEPPVIEEFVPVSMLPIAETTNVKASAKADDPKPEPKPAAKPDPKPKTAPKVAEPAPDPKPEPKPPAPEPKPEPPPPKPEPAPKEEPPPAPAPVAEAEPEPTPTPTPRAKPKEVKEPPKEVAEAEPDEKPEKKPDEPKPEKKPEKKPDKPKPEKKPDEPEPFDIDAAIAGVEDKENDDDPVDKGPETPPADDKPKRGKGDPTAKETATIIDAFKTQVSRCWSPPVGAPDPEKLVVLIRIRLNRDGSLSGMPQYMEPGRMDEPYYRAAAESGRRAIMGCQNYDLPADSYDQWSTLEVEFDPSKMIGL